MCARDEHQATPQRAVIFISQARRADSSYPSILCSLSLFLSLSISPSLRQSAAHAAQVYQVTRSGHEHCDVTEGVLLDITPLVVDGRKLVTLYDKDLTEGVNLLIGK